jgi:hypothetical protein
VISDVRRGEVRRVLRDYVDEHLRWGRTPPADAKRSSGVALARLWEQASLESRANPSDITGLFLESANRVIEINAVRTMMRKHTRIPDGFWLVLYIITFLSFAAMGYHSGVAGTTRSPVTFAVGVAFSAVIVLIADLDRPGEGWNNVDQSAMIDLRDWMNEAKP